MNHLPKILYAALLTLPVGCQESDPSDGSTPLEVPDDYGFDSRFEDGSSVSYSGQAFRHVLIAGLAGHIDKMTARIDDGSMSPVAGTVIGELDFYYKFDGDASGPLPHGMDLGLPLAEVTFDDISSGKDLQGKIAGQDEVGQHKDWSVEFVGWDGASSPDQLVALWEQAIDDMAVARAQGDIPQDPTGVSMGKVYVSAAGQDYKQLLQKFLLGAVAFSQGADDYLDDDTDGKGLLSDHTEPEEEKPYTALEHAWDEGFGYFGAARDYLSYTDDEIAGKGGREGWSAGYHDASGDGKISLLSEYNFGHSTNAAKRDRGSHPSASTDFSGDAIEAFLTGRTIIANADGALTDEELADLQDQRDIAVGAWEKAIAASVVHYINEVLVDMGTFGTEDYSFEDHAKHWSELKGFSLSLQFNPRSPLGNADFARLQTLVGQAPSLPGQDDNDVFRANLLEARALLGQAYGFDALNLGNEAGQEGW